jgi:osmotically-inducible protein OsmY
MIASRLTKALSMAALTASLCAMLQGCPLIVVGAAGGGALMATDRRSVGAQTEDREIQAKSQSMFIGDMPDEAHMDVTVFNRRVLLTGEVPTPESKLKAEAIVRTIPNVQGIINELTVGPPSSFTARSNDAYITSKVKTALFTEKDLGSNFFKVDRRRPWRRCRQPGDRCGAGDQGVPVHQPGRSEASVARPAAVAGWRERCIDECTAGTGACACPGRWCDDRCRSGRRHQVAVDRPASAGARDELVARAAG